MAKLVVLQLMQPVNARSTTRGPINQEVGAPPPPGLPHTMLNVTRVKDMRLAFIENSLLTTRSGPMCKQYTCASKVCHTRAKDTCVTSIVFNCRKLWSGFGVATRNLRQC